MRLPERITHAWMTTLDDDSLLLAESRLHKAFASEEASQRKRLGERYDLMRGSAELLSAWDRWSRVSTEARSRHLHLKRKTKGH